MGEVVVGGRHALRWKLIAVSGAAWLWVWSILRGRWRATVLLAVFAGFAGGVVMTAWEYSRRAGTVVEHRVAALAPADGTMHACPPGADPGVDTTPCDDVDVLAAAYGALAESRYVVGSAFVATNFVTFGSLRQASAVWYGSTSTSIDQHGRIGEFDLVAGRLASAGDPGETLLSEHAASAFRVGPGDSIRIQAGACGAGASPDAATPCTFVMLRVTGIVRTEDDLKPQPPSPPGGSNVTIVGVFPSAAWFRATETGRVPENSQFDFRLARGASLEDVRRDVTARLPGWGVEITAHQNLAAIDALRKAVRLQSRSLLAITVVLFVAAMMFVGQAMSRQIAGEMSDRETLRALGLPGGASAVVAGVRASPIAMGAALIAVLIAGVASPYGPTGLADRADLTTGLQLDTLVLALGAFCVAGAVVIGAVVVGALPAVRSSRAKGSMHRLRGRFPSSSVPVVAWVGMRLDSGLDRRSSVRSVILTTASAVAACVAAVTMVASLHRVTSEPARYGMPWDYAAPVFGDPSRGNQIAQVTRNDPAISAAAFVKTAGPIELPSVPAFFAVSFSPAKGNLPAVIIHGRPPAADDEVAVAPKTLAALRKHVGDTIDQLPTLARGDVVPTKTTTIGPFKIVGEALVTDGQATFGPGNGILLTENARNSLDPSPGGYLVVNVDPSAPAADVVASLVEANGFVVQPSPPADVQGLVEISNTPWVIAAIVSLLAAGALGHGLHTDTRRHRLQLGTMRALGFTTNQVRRSVICRATAIGVASGLIGVPTGVILGQLAWRQIGHQVGLASAPLTPLLFTTLTAIAAVALAAALAVWPAARVARSHLATTLRAE